MQVKTLFSCSLCLVALGCSTGKNICKDKVTKETAYERGLSGSFSLLDHYSKICRKKTHFKNSYTTSYSKGLNDFCSEKRGQEQASFGLSKEKVCVNDESYDKGFKGELSKTCSLNLAATDARKNLSSSNELCKTIPKYKNKYLYELKKQCSYSYGKKLGFLKKSIKNLCLDSSSLTVFKKGYSDGLSRVYFQENLKISREIKTLNLKRKTLKKKLKNINVNEKITTNLEINKLEGQILDLQSLLEVNKKHIK